MEVGFEISLLMFLAISTIELVLGTAFGWMLSLSRPAAQPAVEAETEEKSRQVNEALHRLYELTGSLGHNVDQHANRVESIGKELAQAQAKGSDEAHSGLLRAMAQIAEANERLQGQLSSAERKLQVQAGELQSHIVEARTDALTGLSNRRAFDDLLSSHLAEGARQNTPVALIIGDIDHFKKFNDTHGHLAGDAVLRGVGQMLRQTLPEVNVVARYGGEEFAVIVPGSNALELAEAACAAIEDTSFEFESTTLRVTLSAGLAEALPHDQPAAIIKRADEALYASKRAGRNCVHVYGEGGCQRWPAKVEIPAPPAVEPQPETSAAIEPENRKPRGADALTGLPGRHAFHDDLARRLAQRKRTSAPLSLVVADIDLLHVLNEQHGDAAGDMVLRAVTQFLSAALREMDVIARYEGDRFALMLPSTDLAQATQIADRLRNAVALCRLRADDSDLQFTISAGVAEAEDGDDGDSLLRRSMAALQAAKLAGRNCSYASDGEKIELVEVLSAATVS
jgi:diguanylate cyclase